MKILLATDGSAHSRRALEQAADLAQGRPVEVLVLTVSTLVDFSAYGPLNYAPQTVIEVPSQEEATEILATSHAYLSQRGIKARTLRRVGPCAEAILALAEEEGVELIVMGSHGRTGLTRFLMGSVSQQVLTHAPCSVLIAKGPHVTEQPGDAPADHAGEPLPIAVAEKQ